MTSDSEQMDKEAGRAIGAVGMIFFASVMMVMIGFFIADSRESTLRPGIRGTPAHLRWASARFGSRVAPDSAGRRSRSYRCVEL